jgi:hypothetical protein
LKINVIHVFRDETVDRDLILKKLEAIMTTQAELAQELSVLNEKITKIGGETATLLVKIGELEAAVVAAGELTPEAVAALEALKAQAQAVDDLVADPAP